MPNYDLPAADVAEITLIGTGGGYGESCIVHLANGKWMVVDSCLNPESKEVLPLAYLRKIGVDLNDVLLIVCTHWHGDHIQGLSEVLKHCPKSKFAMARANDLQKFFELVELDTSKVSKDLLNASTLEFSKCLDILRARNLQPVWAGQDRVLLSIDDIQVISLSPSDLTMTKFDKELSTLMDAYGSPMSKIQINSPNAKSVAIFLKLGEHRAILGADLEISTDMGEGWANVVISSTTLDRPSSLFKIPHHGSENGYYLDLWLKHIIKNEPIAKLTPWNRNKGLPQDSMLDKYLEHTSNLYITSTPNNLKPRKRTKAVDKLILQFNPTIHEVKFVQGIIRSRIVKNDLAGIWQVECFEKAHQVVSL